MYQWISFDIPLGWLQDGDNWFDIREDISDNSLAHCETNNLRVAIDLDNDVDGRWWFGSGQFCGSGPARYLAHRYGCRVMGLDITASRHQSALRLTKLVKLDHLVDFRLGNALEMPFSDNTFDVVIGQEAWV